MNESSIKNYSLSLPASWLDLTQPQLKYIFSLIADEKFNMEWIRIFALFHFLNTKILSDVESYFIHRFIVLDIDKDHIKVDSDEIAVWLNELNWMLEFPEFPVRLTGIGSLYAIDNTLSTISFEQYISLDNYYQGYLQCQDKNLILDMAQTLYHDSSIFGRGRFVDKDILYVSTFYWFTSFKIWASDRWPNFLKKVSDHKKNKLTGKQIREAIDAQIRALTKGDISKEKDILDMPCHRALTELDALARESEELRKKLKS